MNAVCETFGNFGAGRVSIPFGSEGVGPCIWVEWSPWGRALA